MRNSAVHLGGLPRRADGGTAVRYAECPTVEVSTDIAATPAVVWGLVSDIKLSSRFSTEVTGAEWIDGHDGQALDERFAGHSSNDAIGEWTTTCVVTGLEDVRVFEWSVIGPDGDVSSVWRYTIDDVGDGTVRLPTGSRWVPDEADSTLRSIACQTRRNASSPAARASTRSTWNVSWRA